MRLQLGERKKERQQQAKVRQEKHDKMVWASYGFPFERYLELKAINNYRNVTEMVKAEKERIRPKAGGLRITEKK